MYMRDILMSGFRRLLSNWIRIGLGAARWVETVILSPPLFISYWINYVEVNYVETLAVFIKQNGPSMTMITGAPRRDHITPMLRQLHCRLQDRRPGFPVFDWSGTWLPGSSSPTSALADFDQQTQRPVSRAARPTSSATDASQLPVHGYGTRCQSI